MATRTRPSRVSRAKVLEQLKLAARKGDRTALALAVDQMRTLAYSPRYWETYLLLLGHPLARLVDLLVIKQGEKIARQKGWVMSKRRASKSHRAAPRKPRSRRQKRPRADLQPSLFPDLP
ncbi:MAG: hypothetical protein HY725_16865 [Candidatus Rokubacteria bacterium]|nr:hypothetical protein [Candidatus Rokubacteria bacterium]